MCVDLLVFSAPCSISDPQIGSSSSSSESDSDSRDPSPFLALLHDPVLIGSIGALLWCLLMVAAVYLFKRHGRMGHMMPGRDRAKGV